MDLTNPFTQTLPPATLCHNNSTVILFKSILMTFKNGDLTRSFRLSISLEGKHLSLQQAGAFRRK